MPVNILDKDIKGRKKLLFIAMVTSPVFLAVASVLPPLSYVLKTILSIPERNISFPLAGLWLTWIGISAVYNRFCDPVVGIFFWISLLYFCSTRGFMAYLLYIFIVLLLERVLRLKEGLYVISVFCSLLPQRKVLISTQISAAHDKVHLDRTITA